MEMEKSQEAATGPHRHEHSLSTTSKSIVKAPPQTIVSPSACVHTCVHACVHVCIY